MSQVEFLYQAVNFFIMLIIAHDQVTKSWIGRYVCLCKVSHMIDLKFKKNHNCTKVHLTTTTTQANISKMGVLASNAKSFLFSSQILILLQPIISNHNDWKNVTFQETKQDIIEFCHSSTTFAEVCDNQMA